MSRIPKFPRKSFSFKSFIKRCMEIHTSPKNISPNLLLGNYFYFTLLYRYMYHKYLTLQNVISQDMQLMFSYPIKIGRVQGQYLVWSKSGRYHLIPSCLAPETYGRYNTGQTSCWIWILKQSRRLSRLLHLIQRWNFCKSSRNFLTKDSVALTNTQQKSIHNC